MELKPSHSGGFSFFNQFTTGTNRSGAVLAGQLLMADTGRQNAASLNMNEGDGASGYANFVAPYLSGTLQGGTNGLYGIVVASVADASPVKLQISGKCQAWIRFVAGTFTTKDSKLFAQSTATNTGRLMDSTTASLAKLIGKLEDDLTAILTVGIVVGNGAGQSDGPESGYFTGVATASVTLAGILFEGINGMR